MNHRLLRGYLDAFLDHETADRLPQITEPTLVLAAMVGRPVGG